MLLCDISYVVVCCILCCCMLYPMLQCVVSYVVERYILCCSMLYSMLLCAVSYVVVLYILCCSVLYPTIDRGMLESFASWTCRHVLRHYTQYLCTILLLPIDADYVWVGYIIYGRYSVAQLCSSMPVSMDDLLSRQWEQSAALLLSQCSKFDSKLCTSVGGLHHVAGFIVCYTVL